MRLCILGEHAIPDDATEIWKEVRGFVGGPKLDSMVLRTNTGSYACDACIEKARRGQVPDQPDIFAETVEIPHCGVCQRPLPHNRDEQAVCNSMKLI